jgi:hypothetical protein
MGTSDVPKRGFYGYDGQGRECPKDKADGGESSLFSSLRHILPANLHSKPSLRQSFNLLIIVLVFTKK